MDLKVSKWTSNGKFSSKDIIDDFKTMESFNTKAEEQEQYRVIGENSRIINEDNRKTNETSRISKESTRVTNESNRLSEENIRISNEDLRKTEESKRVLNENNRIAKETERNDNENSRILNEQTRASNEQSRVTSESNRVSEFNQIKTEFSTYQGIINEINNEITDNTVKTITENSDTISMSDAVDGMMNIEIGGLTLKNELTYNPDTWAEWEKSTGVVGNSSGLSITYSDDINEGTHIPTLLKPSTKYGILQNVTVNTLNTSIVRISEHTTGTNPVICNAGQTGNFKTVITTQSVITNNVFGYSAPKADGGLMVKIKDIRIYELPAGSEIENDFNTLSADELAVKYPWHSGISSVGEAEDNKIEVLSKGKNLFNGENMLSNFYHSFGVSTKPVWDGKGIKRATSGEAVWKLDLKLKPNTKYNLLKSQTTDVQIGIGISSVTSYTTGNDGMLQLILYYSSSSTQDSYISNIQLEEGTTATPYEPYREDKINILTTEPLRGLPNGVRDIASGDIVERKVGKVVLDGSGVWEKAVEGDNVNGISMYINSNEFGAKQSRYHAISDKFNTIGAYTPSSLDFAYINDVGGLVINIPNSKTGILEADSDETKTQKFKQYLQANPTTVYYELAEPVIEKLPQPLTLQSFANGTLQVNSSIPPYLTVKYPTNISSRISTIEEINNTMLDSLGGAWRTLLILADKELAMKSIQPLTTTDDISKKVNNILEVWK